jgi:hypothetical protein
MSILASVVNVFANNMYVYICIHNFQHNETKCILYKYQRMLNYYWSFVVLRFADWALGPVPIQSQLLKL